MRPARSTPAHQTGDLAELVCSNSLRSDDPDHPAGLLKREMEALGSLIIPAAREAALPAGGALAVDRHRFAATVTSAIERHPRITIQREELMSIPDGPVVIATGPLTSEALAGELQQLLGEESLYFYDAMAPDRGCRVARLWRVVLGLALRQGRRRRLPQQPDDRGAILGFRRSGAVRRNRTIEGLRSRALLRGLLAD